MAGVPRGAAQLTDGLGGLADEGMTAPFARALGRPASIGPGYAPLIELPYLSYLVDVLAGPYAWRFIAALPPERGVIAGAADVQTETLPETEVLVWAMAWAARGERGSKRVGVSPNGTLAVLSRHFAHRKAQRCGESVTVAQRGPALGRRGAHSTSTRIGAGCRSSARWPRRWRQRTWHDPPAARGSEGAVIGGRAGKRSPCTAWQTVRSSVRARAAPRLERGRCPTPNARLSLSPSR